MKPLVVDASVAIKWLIPEEFSAESENLLQQHVLTAPDLILPEMGNILWKYYRRRALELQDAMEILESLFPPPFTIHESGPLLKFAYFLASQYDRTVYDSLYLALACLLDTKVVTADLRLVNAIRKTALAAHVAWIGEPDWT